MVGKRLPGEAVTYASADKVDINENGQDSGQYLVEMLNTRTTGSELSDNKFTLKVSSPVMLLGDIDPFKGHVNESRYLLKAVHTYLLMLE